MQEAYEKDFGCYYLVLLLSGPQPAASAVGGGEPTPEEGRVTGDWVTEWNWSDQVSQEQQTWMGNRKMEPWRRVAADTEREETGPKKIRKRADFLL